MGLYRKWKELINENSLLYCMVYEYISEKSLSKIYFTKYIYYENRSLNENKINLLFF